jgi:hypothetical protein
VLSLFVLRKARADLTGLGTVQAFNTVTLDQAVAKKVQDEANLSNAKLDLQRFADLGASRYRWHGEPPKGSGGFA